ncbi:MAG: DCC1-like thiol-disulfide oxidoreductase family protein [Bacteroidota bacterium]
MSKKVNVYYDKYCRLCNSAINIAQKNDSNKCFTFISNENLDIKDTVIVEDGDILYQKSEAISIILKKINFRFSYLIISIIPKFLSNLIYDFIAKYRYSIFGKIK